MGFNRLTRRRETTLYKVFRQAIGLKSVINEAPVCLGTNVRIVLFVAEGMKDVRKKFWIECTTSLPTMVQATL